MFPKGLLGVGSGQHTTLSLVGSFITFQTGGSGVWRGSLPRLQAGRGLTLVHHSMADRREGAGQGPGTSADPQVKSSNPGTH